MQDEVKTRSRSRRRKKRRSNRTVGKYLLPNILTTGNLFSGFVSLVYSIDGEYEKAAVAVLVSWIFDILDGKVARLSGATSRFGVEYDSLADLVSFGVAPALLIYLWALKPLGRIGWLGAFLFVACGALRLARFNVQASGEEKKYFTGLPIPGAAGFIATLTLFAYPFAHQPGRAVTWLFLIITISLALLMVSTVRYSVFKELESLRTRQVTMIMGILAVLVVVAAKPRYMLFALLAAYTLSGPSVSLGKRIKSLDLKVQECGETASARSNKDGSLKQE
ncbi:CDP-diacylglycerol--serine O-phosphatidyltransferase [Thermodesulforhabdus norvegica]|uniref:CDP-diacylglycerol--serine O-phosphatidyltransferase n=1 Tax=Thermodesulforhabdus norvegica TaxID=39841 RepID=A0A1I4RJZ8_9BACT|nr:CDP-diacylglycerol--serine O-phosphatidyltransferase [Thermodesulforhabdus norvegica]SFM52547.1 CDP-diacylglycerol--serine O-phosphatidyltransferase [Thermodesulforhabdus norvegica]